MKKFSIIIVAFLLSFNLFSQTNWYIDYQNGNNSNNGTSVATAKKTVDYLISNNLIQAGDTVFIIGEYHNPSYDHTFTYGGNSDRNNPHIWHKENTIRISNLNGTRNQPITFKAYDNNTVIKGDGANIFRITNSSYLKIEDFEIYGEVEAIPLSTAEGLETDGLQFLYLASNTADELHPTLSEVLYRVNVGTSISTIENASYPNLGNGTKRPSYIDTRGLYASGCHHLEIKNNTIHHMPGGGLRVSESSFVKIIGNEVHNCSRRSYSGTHALVVTKAKNNNSNSSDDTTYSIVIEKNTIRDNYNEIFSWAPTKTIITPRIDEGKGISLQRNNLNPWKNGTMRILVKNNLCYWNGFSGLHSNAGWHIDFINNTCYMNSYTNSVTYANSSVYNQAGGNIGISASNSDDVKIYNNISVIDTDWNGKAIAANGTPNLVVEDNLIYGINGTVQEDSDVTDVDLNTMIDNPLFIDAANFNFGLQSNSPAIGEANSNAPTDDFFGNSRDINPDLGAIEYGATNAIANILLKDITVYPNPTSSTIYIKNADVKHIELFDILGKKVSSKVTKLDNGLDLSQLKSGIYLLKTEKQVIKIIKL